MDKAAAWLRQTLDYEFLQERLLREALTHRSASGTSNERLEFLGDAVLDFVISHAVFERRPEAPEGDLSRLRASLVNDNSLAALADAMRLGEHLMLGSGEKKTGGHRRSSILADALEAIFGAVYIDRGFAAAEKVILHVFEKRLVALPDSETLKDPKTRLQELLQAGGHGLPDYAVTGTTGLQHRQTFDVACTIAALHARAEGRGGSRRKAEQAAAEAMLATLAARADGRKT